MSRRWIGVVLLSGALVLSACGSSGDGGDDGASGAGSTTTTAAPTTTEAPVTTTEADPTPTTVVDGSGAVDCQALLEEYAAVFVPEDLTEVIALFRSLVPNMPDDVAAATTRLADAYEEADANLANIDMADVDLSADAETFSDWTNAGCPPG